MVLSAFAKILSSAFDKAFAVSCAHWLISVSLKVSAVYPPAFIALIAYTVV